MTDEEKACKAICNSIPCKTMCTKCKCYIAGLKAGREEDNGQQKIKLSEVSNLLCLLF